ncbi:Dps family protein [Stutzerimonas tarimensis]|uniref:Dps family protein n=1 Tax=Stutzerimonas tarimensis TaxID=1507735 RepID=A0ABV7T6Q7_9GAMM
MASTNARHEFSAVENIRNRAQQSPDAGIDARAEIGEALSVLLADVFSLYLKTKNFHWHISGPHFRDYHLMLDEQAGELFAMTDPIAERARKLGQPTLRSVEQIVARKRLVSSEVEGLSAEQMLAELHADNLSLAAFMRSTHGLTDGNNDVATTSLLEEWIDQTEERAWFLQQTLGR